MDTAFKIDDIVCEIGNPKIKMVITSIDNEKNTATCSWIADRKKSMDKTFKDFPLSKLTLAINYAPKKF